MPVPVVSLLDHILPCLGAALGSTVPVTAPMCCWQPSTQCSMAQGCPPCLPLSCCHPNCPVFLGQAAKTASKVSGRAPWSKMSHWKVPKGWKSPSCFNLLSVTLEMAIGPALFMALRDQQVPGIPPVPPSHAQGQAAWPGTTLKDPTLIPFPRITPFSHPTPLPRQGKGSCR